MAFNTGLSGVNAANQDLKVTGNNIANASTTGFKLSRAEFGDAYTQSILGMGSTRPGAGVNVANIGQKFTQGDISQTGNALDLAIDGTGFFITNYEGEKTTYTRNGIFGVSDEGYLVNNQNARLQGFGITEQDTADGILGDIRIEQGAQPPQATQVVDAGVNVPAGASVLAEMGSMTRTRGLAIGQVQTGAPESTATRLDTIGAPQIAGTPASALGSVNTADRYTGTADVPTSYIYTTGTTPVGVNTLVGDNPVTAGNANVDGDIEFTVTDASGDTSTVQITTDGLDTTDTGQLIVDIRDALNNSDLSGQVFVREDPTGTDDRLEFYTVNGTTIDSVSNVSGTALTDLGLNSTTNDARLLLNDANGEAFDIELENLSDGSTPTLNLNFPAPGSLDTKADLITFLQGQLDGAVDPSSPSAYLSGYFTVSDTGSGIEISTAETSPFKINNISDAGGDNLGQQLNIVNGASNERVFQNIPDASDSIQLQILDPSVNNGTPTTVQLQPLPTEESFNSLASMIERFQESLDNHSVLGGRVQIQEDPNNAGQVQLLSTTGTSIQSVSDLGSSNIAVRLNLVSGMVDDSIYDQIPPSSPETMDISLQGPNINDGDAITVTIEPFPVGSEVNNLGQLINSFQRAIDNDSTLAGRVRVEESDTNPGRIRLVADGPFASDGTAILNITDNVGDMATLLGMDMNDGVGVAPTVTAPIAGTDLFADGGNLDLTSIEGTPVRVQGNEPLGVEFNNLELGSATTLTGSLNLTGSHGDGTGDLNMIIQSGNAADTLSISVPGAGFSASGLVNAINSQINASSLLNNRVSASLDSSNRLRFTNDTNDPSPIVVTDNGSTDALTADYLGLTSNSNPKPTLVNGELDRQANNELDIRVGGDNPGNGTIVIPAGEYDNAEAVVESINTQINSTAALLGKVEAEEVNGRVQFALTELGGFPNTLEVDGSTEALDAMGHTVQSRPTAIDPVDRRSSFRINLSVPLPDVEGRSGSVEIQLAENLRSIEQLAQAINRELSSADEEDYIGVRAQVVTNEDGTKHLAFEATEEGEASQISITDIRAPGEDIDAGTIAALLQVDRFNNDYLEEGVAAVTNGYPEQTFVLDDGEGSPREVTLAAEQSAAQIANQLSDLPGVKASANTELTFRNADYRNNGDMNVRINGQWIQANNFDDMVSEINGYQQSTLRGVTAEIAESGDLVLRSRAGADIQVEIDSPAELDRLTLSGAPNSAPITLGGTAGAETTARVGGTVEIILNHDVAMTEPEPRVSGLFNGLSGDDFQDYVINNFNPDDATTYNETASLQVYDSLGTPHQLQMFFVKDPDDPDRPQDLNSWTVYAQVDGQDVGDPDPNLPFPENQEPTQASFKMFFSPDGTLDKDASGDWLVSNWLPRSEDGNATGAYAPETQAEGGSLPLEDPNLTSNFEINFRNTTQYGGDFARNDFQQDGYSSGRLRNVQVDDEGNIFARYTNGEDQLLGQVAIANFRNPEGLESVGFTEWMATGDSGDVTVSTAGTGVLGDIQSSSLEESNVDLSEQLVNLIVAQRNYQANAKTIETTNAVTQTIINLR